MEQTYHPQSDFNQNNFAQRGAASTSNFERKSDISYHTQQRDTSNNGRRKIFDKSPGRASHNQFAMQGSQQNIVQDISVNRGQSNSIYNQDKKSWTDKLEQSRLRQENQQQQQVSQNNIQQRSVSPRPSQNMFNVDRSTNQTNYQQNQQQTIQTNYQQIPQQQQQQSYTTTPQNQQYQKGAFQTANFQDSNSVTPNNQYDQKLYQQNTYQSEQNVYSNQGQRPTAGHDTKIITNIEEYQDENVKRNKKYTVQSTNYVEQYDENQGISKRATQQPQLPVTTQYQIDQNNEMDIYLFNYSNQDAEQNYQHQITKLKEDSENVSACNIF